ncbi:ABC transporter ATP-binding protein [Exiguobacterium algae]|uniref:ABC transporter ATP-binding protein n=1 Tax=Exiguobacterium algae TaxID=2751250 RepID=UPI001BEC08BF|nr:ABC transporter ATP-binding protein [Exiguobacterium algae]
MPGIMKVEHVTSGYGEQMILNDISLEIPSHQISIIIGANGCGKSTLLKTMARLIHPTSGHVTLNNKPITKMAPKRLARVLGMLPQSPIVPEGITVSDLVGRGRYPYQSFMKGWSQDDYEAVAEAMEMMNITEFADRPIDELSGGQRQRVWIAMALAQQTDILFLDEPTTFLDITYQVEILDLLTDLNRKFGTTIVMVLHDINLSARYADYLFALKQGRLVAEGKPADIVTSDLIHQVFNLRCSIMVDPVSGSPSVVPIGRHHVREDEDELATKLEWV